MNTLHTPTSPATPISNAADRLGQFADRTAARAEGAIETTKRVADDSLDAMQDSVTTLRNEVPDALGRTASQVEALARRGIEQARATSASMRAQVARTGDRTVDYIQTEPVKAMLIAAAVGATLVTLAGWLGSNRRGR